MTNKIVIAGAGHAAGQVVASLRQQKFDGQIVLVGDEPYLPYQRPPLSKKYLAGEMSAERLYVKPGSFYDDPRIDVRLRTRIKAIDRTAKTLQIDDGKDINYDKLVLALGSRPRKLPVDGADLENVHYLRNIEDVEGIRAERGLHWPGSRGSNTQAWPGRNRDRDGGAGDEPRRVTRNIRLLSDRTHESRRKTQAFYGR
jgi:3-phenylpropionate/trans-cinnamate dioxygenase ferredoxin reductase subunit